ncbi:MAG: 3-oxoacyl-ACP reductase FabG [Actinomycetota bacterium]|nr:3-oxoacyl-ACP reductase FabG [Actinomycetota bacterium]
MSDPVALVTGSSRGIGRAIAIALAEGGRSVAINYRSGADEAKETLRLVQAAGGDGVCVQGDVGDSADVDRCFKEVEGSLGSVRVLVNNAGARMDGLALSMSDDAWEKVIRTNLFGTFACCRRALRPMVRARWGRIVNITSITGLRGSPGQANYSAAKAGVIGLTRTLAREVAGKGITVNAVAPGLIETDLTSDLPAERFEALVSETPLKRPGVPEDVAGLVAYLCSDGANYVTGSTFVADGGLTA